jgi:chemotaxis regulatin CheY-phosphate phosphatase CheZ
VRLRLMRVAERTERAAERVAEIVVETVRARAAGDTHRARNRWTRWVGKRATRSRACLECTARAAVPREWRSSADETSA